MSTPLTKPPHAVARAVPMAAVVVKDEFWSPRQEKMAKSSLLLQHAKLEEYHHIDNFRVAAGEKQSTFVGMFYYDSDVYKWIEAATYALYTRGDKALAERLDEVVGLVVRSQKPDGYINTFFNILFPEERMKHFFVMHELYCAGHLIEAAVARYELFEKRDLLDCAIKCADFLINFDPAGTNKRYVPGHQEVELALVRLFRCTGDVKYLDLAVRFLDGRGRDPALKRTALAGARAVAGLLSRQANATKEWERQHGHVPRPATRITLDTAGASIWNKGRFIASYLSGRYLQQHLPVRDQHEPVGHAVRATYMYSAMADVLVERGDAGLSAALLDAWECMTRSRMYLTGGIGALPLIEGFGRDHELDNEHAYCETCAAIGSFLWNWRMLLATGAARHADLMELLLYNAILPGWSMDGTRYRYTNPLASRRGFSHREWFDCACCPPNLGRIVSGLGQYIASTDGNSSVYLALFIGSHVDVSLDDGTKMSFDVTTGFPWATWARICFTVTPGRSTSFYLRVPAWAEGARVTINGEALPPVNEWGVFIKVERDWKPGDVVHVDLDAPPAFVLPDPSTKANRGRVAIRQGPLVYCIDRASNPWFVYDEMAVDITGTLVARAGTGMFGGVNVLVGNVCKAGARAKGPGPGEFVAIPYFIWGNGEKGPMQVWLKAAR